MPETPAPLPPWRTRLRTALPPGSLPRYVLVGGFNTVFGYAVYAGLTALLMPRLAAGYMVASLLGSIVAITVSFVNHKLFVFKTQGNWLREWWRCVAVYGSSMLLGLMALPLLVWGCEWLTGEVASAPYVAGAVWTMLTVGWNFWGHKNFAFAGPPSRPAGPEKRSEPTKPA
ncbi:MAG: GtrA family protein [Candidatus Sericytochromatia bacterium]|nr:GtrA family protein [Candidatus Sericytochromatia bacterium]